MAQFKMLAGIITTMFGSAELLAVVIAPYVDRVAPEQMDGSTLGMFFLGLATVYFGAMFLGDGLNDLGQRDKYYQRIDIKEDPLV